MQKSKKSIILFMLIVVILLVIAFICIFQKEKNDRLIDIYNKISSSSRFTFSMEEINLEYNYKISISQRGTDINIDMNIDNEHTSTLILDGHAYFIMHDNEEYYDYNSEDIDGDIIISGLKEATEKQYVNGHEEINGRTYYYEEYEGVSTFSIFLDEGEDTTIRTRFYFDGNDIIYVKNMLYYDKKVEEEELLKVTLEYDVDDSIFEIPADYAEI